MKTASDIVQILLERPVSVLLDRKTGMPYGWSLWLRAQAMREKPGAGKTRPSEWIEAMAQRPAPEASDVPVAMGTLSAFRSLFYQDWEPAPREQRGMRWFAGITSFLIHTLFVLFLLWMALVTWVPLPPVEGDEGSRVRLEFIGQGTPEDAGGGAPTEAGETAPAASTSAASSAGVSMQVPAVSTPLPASEPAMDMELPPVAEQQIPEPAPAQQILQVTETEVPTVEFVLPPVTRPLPDSIQRPITDPTVTVQEREITVVRPPVVNAEVRDVRAPAPQISGPVTDVRQREVPAPLAVPQTVRIPDREMTAPQLRGREQAVRQIDIPAPSSGTAAAGSALPQGTSSAAAAASTATVAPGGEQARNTAQGGRSEGAASGPTQARQPGGTPSQQRGDDWGLSDRNQAGTTGGATGLFDGDGRVRLPGEGSGNETAQQRGAPGGANDSWSQDKIDRAGTWMERPPYGYEPTRFDRYWVPNENLLEEWVRKNIRTTSIPIPGTSKRIVCVISVLQLGGGCGVVDDNLNEQPATARPPPEIPVKRTPIPTDS